MNYIKQLLYELRNQKLVTWVSISGTALAIFLIMATFMADKITNVSIAPESNRDRILKGQNIDFHSQDGSSGSGWGIDYNLAKRLYENLDGVERLSFIAYTWNPYDVGLPKQNTITAQGLEVDDEFWKIYDYKFISGSPFEKAEIEAEKNLAIITESTARDLFKETDVAGRDIDIDGQPYQIKGVVEDSFPLLPDGTVKVFTNFSKKGFETSFGDGFFGKSSVRLLLEPGVDPEKVKQQVEKRYADINREIAPEGNELKYHMQPYTSAEMSSGSFGSNNDPQLKYKTRLKALIYIILLLLPAINLSSMTQSRLQKRISEIGVRRAFGAKRRVIIFQIFTENLILSFVGGVIGLGLSLIFIAFLSGYFVSVTDLDFNAITTFNLSPVIWQIFDFSVFFIAFGSCFVLNLLSAFVPAWRASAVEPAVAISKTR
ncbi:MAG: ABC transporter permease [Muribaculaceae bacterium]|nr:ABC transporter permease [Muribaculaceae bacterium]